MMEVAEPFPRFSFSQSPSKRLPAFRAIGGEALQAYQKDVWQRLIPGSMVTDF
jgi:hypothetical protein